MNKSETEYVISVKKIAEFLIICVPILTLGNTIKLIQYYSQYNIHIFDFIEIDELILKGISPLSPFLNLLIFLAFLIWVIVPESTLITILKSILIVRVINILPFIIIIFNISYAPFEYQEYSNMNLTIDNRTIVVDKSLKVIGITKNYIFFHNLKDSTVSFTKIPEDFSGIFKYRKSIGIGEDTPGVGPR